MARWTLERYARTDQLERTVPPVPTEIRLRTWAVCDRSKIVGFRCWGLHKRRRKRLWTRSNAFTLSVTNAADGTAVMVLGFQSGGFEHWRIFSGGVCRGVTTDAWSELRALHCCILPLDAADNQLQTLCLWALALEALNDIPLDSHHLNRTLEYSWTEFVGEWQLIDATANGEDMRKQWLTPETEEKLKELKPKFLMEFQVNSA